jgi:hypothetical protein
LLKTTGFKRGAACPCFAIFGGLGRRGSEEWKGRRRDERKRRSSVSMCISENQPVKPTYQKREKFKTPLQNEFPPFHLQIRVRGMNFQKLVTRDPYDQKGRPRDVYRLIASLIACRLASCLKNGWF